MASRDYESLILGRLQGLPPKSLAEIADFVDFVRARSQRGRRLGRALGKLNREQEAHLEEEFAGYDQLYPRE
ncbi:MAG TPA: hypothetical protein PLE19_05790 [Planctomycetota bacterium]|nr:hypothetical protein [Planctomycetota bacterium]HRR82595.1 hypothetical protein [Planctomycetota bacterium]HRT96401.1 hypothetical protein [Planctomycetota bacterium]